MIARHHARPRLFLLPLLIVLGALAPAAFASIGEAPSTIVKALDSYKPTAADSGFTAASNFDFQIDSSANIAIAVSGSGIMNDANVRFASDLIGAATGYGQGIAGPAAQFFRTRLSDLAGKGPAAIGVEEYELHLTVTGDSPYHLDFTLKPQTVDPSAFPPASHSIGPANAKHVIREFSDFQCPFCARFATDVFPQLKAELLSSGDVRFEFHYFPLKSIHPNAMTAAEAAECVTAANDPASFWTYHDALFASQDSWSGLSDPVSALVKIASDAGLKTDGVTQCIHDGTYSGSIDKAFQAAANDLHLTGTPTLFVDNLKVGDYTQLATYKRLMTLSDAMRAASNAPSGGATTPATPSGGGSGQ
ncbi:MAG: thioredoxin domain-containing protein [Deinococcales bacterium]